MNRATADQRLRRAEQHISRGEYHIARQHQRIAYLERNGFDTTEASQLLALLEKAQRLHMASRERIQKELRSAD